MDDPLGAVFHLRRAVARIGETDWMRWWESYALGPTGDSIVPRLFRRTPELSAAHISFLAARTEHRRGLPKEDLVHLFDFGEEFEGGFERWLIERKAEGWTAKEPVPEPGESLEQSAQEVLMGLVEKIASEHTSADDPVTLGDVTPADLGDPGTRVQLARELTAAYASSGVGQLRVPFFRVRR